jgi:hypothetical protein
VLHGDSVVDRSHELQCSRCIVVRIVDARCDGRWRSMADGCRWSWLIASGRSAEVATTSERVLALAARSGYDALLCTSRTAE